MYELECSILIVKGPCRISKRISDILIYEISQILKQKIINTRDTNYSTVKSLKFKIFISELVIRPSPFDHIFNK